MDEYSDPQVPLMITKGIRNQNDGVAIMRIDQIKNYPCLFALNELIEVLEKESRTEPVNAAARNAAVWIIESTQGTAKMEMIGRVLSASEKTADGIMLILSRNAEALPLEAKKLALESGNVGIGAKAEIIRKSGGEESYELLGLLRISNDPDKFEVVWNVAGAGTKDEALRIEAMKELASFGNESAIEFFETALGNASPNLRNQAIRGLISLWSEDSENNVERILCAQLAREKNQGLKLSIVQWIGENGRHTVSKKALLGVVAIEDDPRLVSVAENALREIRARLLAKPARFQSGPGIFDKPAVPQYEGRATIDAEPAGGEVEGQPVFAASVARKSDVRELALKLRSSEREEREYAADSLAFIAAASRDRRELNLIASLLAGCGGEFGQHLREVRARLERAPLSSGEGAVPNRPSKRPTPPAPPPVFEKGELVRGK